MSKVDLITLYADNTHDVTRCNVEKDKVKHSRNWNPKIKPGRSVFPERSPKGLTNLGKILKYKLRRKKRVVIGIYGAEECFVLPDNAGKLNADWDLDEAERFVNKIISWASARLQMFSNVDKIIIFCMLGGLLVLRIYQLWRVGF